MSMIHVNRDRQNLGLFSPEEIAEGLRSQRFLPTDLAWQDGMEGWQPLATFTDLPTPVAEEVPDLPGEEHLSEAEELLPWENRSKVGMLRAVTETIFLALGHSANAFGRLSTASGMLPPYAFYLLVAMPAFAINLVENFAVIKFAIAAITSNAELMADPQTAKAMALFKTPDSLRLIAIWFAFVLLVIVPCLPLIWGGIYHLMLRLFGGARESLVKTFAVTCYVFGAAAPLTILPCCGQLAMTVWSLVALSIGLAAAHRTDSWRSTLAVLLPFLFCCGSYMALNLLGAAGNLAASGMPS